MINKNILEICMSPDLGGLELYMAKSSLFLNDCFNVTTVINEGSKLEDYFKSKVEYKILQKKSNIFMFLSARKLAKIIDTKEIELIHLHWTKDIPFVVLAKLISHKKPKIIQSRHMTMTRYKDDFYHNFLYKNIELMLPVTKQVKEQLIKFIPESVRPKLEVLYVGSDELKKQELLKLQNSGFHIGMVGRINREKGQHLLIEAVSILKSKGVTVNAHIVGNPMQESYLEELKALVKDKKLEDRVFFLGFVKEPQAFYEACDVVVLASKKETFGLVLVEAMKVGVAVIGSNSGGVVEIIDNKKTGLLFESQNAKSLADSIEVLYKDETLKKSLAQEGQKKSNVLFSNKVQFPKLVEIITNL
ncbi:glycosyltransferase [Sulfurimonas sp. SAG-AH-194-C20]|nr:glycosyltransferase [Sulfurimonas sp. SAG-AH-194-C20]MDF1878447.1 glycosyltransferase [Sulfurimonas sp. SAG-AH-194-C20]